jgi:Tol biopolymer transport system component
MFGIGRSRRGGSLVCVVLAGQLAAVVAAVSVPAHAVQAMHSEVGSISDSGRFVVFYSSRPDLVAADTNARNDVFIRDVEMGVTRRVSLGINGTEANGDSLSPVISGDGRYVAFNSYASNLVRGDSNDDVDVFLHDLRSGTTRRVSDAVDGQQPNGGAIAGAAVSVDGRYVAFTSWASNLVAGDSNGDADVFLRDMRTGRTRRVSVGESGAEAHGVSAYPTISGDGRFVAFNSTAEDLVGEQYANGTVDVFVRDVEHGTTRIVSVSVNGGPTQRLSLSPSLSRDGRFVAFYSSAPDLAAGDVNNEFDVFVRDLQYGTTRLVSVSSDGIQSNFYSSRPAISGAGRYVAFYSAASNLVPSDTNQVGDIFVHDRQCHTTHRVSVGNDGAEGNAGAGFAAITPDGRYVAFTSLASNLTAGPDLNAADDVFLRDLIQGSIQLVSAPSRT